MLAACSDTRRQTETYEPDDIITAVSATSDLQGRALMGEAEIQIFGCDGAWFKWEQPNRWNGQSYGPDVRLTGAYTLTDGRLCVTPEGGAQSCQTIAMISGAEVALADGDPNGDEADNRRRVAVVGGEENCGPTRVPDEEIRKLFAGASLVSDPRIVVHDAAERRSYACDGTWRDIGGQADPSGEYSVSNNQLCISVQGVERYCQSVYRGEDGQVYRSYAMGGPTLPGELVAPINLVRDVPSCD